MMSSFNLAILFIVTITLQLCLGFGGIDHVDKDRHPILNETLINKSVILVNKIINSNFWYAQTNITNVTIQIVNGLLLQYNLHLTRTNCTKHNRMMQKIKNNQKIRCQFNHNTTGRVCQIQILLQPWTKQHYRMTIKSCNPEMKSMNNKKYPPKHHQTMIPYNQPSSIINNRVLF
ncbi:hypothetical protein MS3_00010987 [Schistosoma haematobium]|uniref:Cystatin domain-containing protein n=1 Tax=Schistosoma haematobium TaxID=6185 RepID=A0A922LHK6_SCHHA|nr:hypothetical protein MS3_00010987 [Schistosoma haematobium]KAH9583877.1 hypothetical protein MS3_00010987 [Schistosoma haematobium]CAH8571373.1 unnamed protein product [Schistosoma haematobium]